MNVLYILLVISILLAGGFLLAFVWAVRSGQYDDTCTPSMRLLADDEKRKHNPLPLKEN